MLDSDVFSHTAATGGGAPPLVRRDVSRAAGPTITAAPRVQALARRTPSRTDHAQSRNSSNGHLPALTLAQQSSAWPLSKRLRFGARHPAFIQQMAVRYRRSPRAVEEMDEIMGIPKIVWVILADVVAMAVFVSCVPFLMTIYKHRNPEDEEITAAQRKALEQKRLQSWDQLV